MRRALLVVLLAACSSTNPDADVQPVPAPTPPVTAPGGSGTETTSTGGAHFTATVGEEDEVTFTACDSDAPGIVYYAWDFGDGQRGSGAKTSHVFADGAREVKLTITTEAHANGLATKTIETHKSKAPTFVTDATGHPRLYVDAAHLAQLKTKTQTAPILGAAGHFNSYVAGMLLDATAHEGAEYYDTTGKACVDYIGPRLLTGDAIIGQGRQISDCILTLATAAALGGKPKYGTDAIAAMVKLANWPVDDQLNSGFGRWDCGACLDHGSNLQNGELLYGTAVAYDLLASSMSAGDRSAIESLLVREAKFLYQASMSTVTWWSSENANNWDAVTHGGLGVAGLALKGVSGASDAQKWIDRSVERIHHYLDTNYDADGVNYEDSDHYGYGLEYAVEFLLALRNDTGQDEFGYRNGLLAKTLQYRVAALEGNHTGIMPNDGVALHPTSYPAQLLLASVFRDREAQWAWDVTSGQDRPASLTYPFKVGGNGAAGQVPHTAFFFDDTLPKKKPSSPLGKVYPDFGRALFRSGWEASDTTFEIEAGVFGSHGKPNQGHFFFTDGGKQVLVGGSSADSADYNVIQVTGNPQSAPGDWSKRLASTRSSLVTPFAQYVSFDTAAAYQTKLSKARRDVLFVPGTTGRSYVFVADDLAAAASTGFTWRAHAASAATLVDGAAKVGGTSIVPIEGGAITSGTTLDIAAPDGPTATFGVLIADAAYTKIDHGAIVGDDVILHHADGASWTAEGISSDAVLLLSRKAGMLAGYDTTTLTRDGVMMATASTRVDLTVADDRVWVVTKADVDLSIHTAKGHEVGIAVDDALAVFATPANGMVSVHLGAGNHTVAVVDAAAAAAECK